MVASEVQIVLIIQVRRKGKFWASLHCMHMERGRLEAYVRKQAMSSPFGSQVHGGRLRELFFQKLKARPLCTSILLRQAGPLLSPRPARFSPHRPAFSRNDSESPAPASTSHSGSPGLAGGKCITFLGPLQ